MNPVSERDSFPRGKVPLSYISALCDIGDKLVTSKMRHKTCVSNSCNIILVEIEVHRYGE